MKKIIFILTSLLSLNLYAQKTSLFISEVQNFEHPLMLTNDAIKQDKVTYTQYGKTDVTLFVDFDSKQLIRTINQFTDTLPIISIEKKEKNYDFNVFYNNKTVVNYVITESDYSTDKKRVICRWIEDDIIKGWDSRNSEIKKEN